MVPTLAQYQYVEGIDVDVDHPHGDLDRILWDGEVMPLRTGNTASVDRNGDPIPRKNILRGEDICFLQEAYVERLHLKNFVPAVDSPSNIPNKTFSCKLGWEENNYQVIRLIDGFNDLGAMGGLWVPETGLPQTGDFDGTFTLSDAWPGLLTWPERKPMRSQNWMYVSHKYPDFPDFTDWRLIRRPIERMFENLKLMTSVSCQVCEANAFADDSHFTSEYTERRGSSTPTHTTLPGCAPLYNYSGKNGWYMLYPGQRVPDQSSRQILTSGSAVVASNLLLSAELTPVYVARGYVEMLEQARNPPVTPAPRGYVLRKTRYYCLVGNKISVPASGEFTIDSSTLLNIVSHLRGLLASDGFDESFAEGHDDSYDRRCSMEINLEGVHLIVTLGSHTRWWI